MTSGLFGAREIASWFELEGMSPDLFEVAQAWALLDGLVDSRLKSGELPGIMRGLKEPMQHFEPAFTDARAFAGAILMAGWGEEIEDWDNRMKLAIEHAQKTMLTLSMT